MAVTPSVLERIAAVLERLDRRLLAWSTAKRLLVIAATIVVMLAWSLPNVPRQWVDLSGTWLGAVQRHETWGSDSLSDMYGARVVLNDPSDMFTKARTEQTPLEAATWSKEASAPYPPVVLLIEAGLLWLGTKLGVGFYGMILACAIGFLAASLLYFWQTRWYLFPLLYLNFKYFSERFVYVQDNTYLVMLVVIIGALWLARKGRPATHAAMALATTIKLSPLYYAKNVFGMPRAWAVAYIAILGAGLVLPYFIWENYLYIYRYGNALKGDAASSIGAALGVAPFALVLWWVETRRRFDLEDRVGWGLVPFALFLALKMNVARHLLIVLLVPDRRGVRNLAAAAGLALPAIAPGLVAFNSSLAIAAVVLVAILVYHVRAIGLDVARDDLAHPARTLRMMLRGGA